MDIRTVTIRARPRGAARAGQEDGIGEGITDALTTFFTVLGAGAALFLLLQRVGLF